MGYRIDQWWCKKHGNKSDRNFTGKLKLAVADPECFLRGGAKGRGVNNHGMGVATKYCALERKMYPGSGASPQPLFTVVMLLRRVFVVFVSSGRRKTPPLVAMNI